ncbi:hypothetical protein ATCC90586_008304 [Pythium insidiosum]|nr:hypothetical protein ATCC90586_008304 [Pythium insidiosum]
MPAIAARVAPADLAALPAEQLFETVSKALQKGSQRPVPHVEVQFRDLTITVNLSKAATKPFRRRQPLPTVANLQLPKQKVILNSVSGTFRPGTITLVLGQPGSGKSSLMKILSGRFPVERDVTVSGSISYNGRPRRELLPRLPQFVAYVDQHDRHLPMLTVKETLDFAFACNGGGKLTKHEAEFLTRGNAEENAEALELATSVTKAMPQITTNLLGLTGCKDTLVGDAMIRGISGGQRKRVTTGEMMFGKKNVLIMDEISTGLDSAATFDIVKSLRALAKQLSRTIVISLLQPSPEVFDLFDEVLLLNEGEVMYHGPRDRVQEHFANLGLRCPPRRDLADFLLDLGSSAQLQYHQPGRTGIPREAAVFAAAFRSSPYFAVQREALDMAPDVRYSKEMISYMDMREAFRQSFLESLWTMFKREMLLARRNIGFFRGRVGMVVVMGVLNGNTFFQIDPKNAQVAMGTLFGAVLFLSMGQVPALPTFFACRDVFYKQRGANFLRASAYVVAFVLSKLPMAVFETIIFGPLIYWLCGFVNDPSAFLMFELLLFLANVAFIAYFFFMSAVTPDIHVGKPLSILSVGILVIFAGFIVSKDHLPDYLVWLYWLDPIAWVIRALAVNQYRNKEFEDLWYSVPDPSNPGKMKDLLKGITGYAAPGTMTALMGSSGAGKTTLMDVIAGRKTGGKIRGDILLNGHAATKQYAATWSTQMRFVVKRFFVMYWRTTSYTMASLAMGLILALLFGAIFAGSEYGTYSGVNSGVGMVYLSSFFMSAVAFNSAIPLASEERINFYREQAAQMYHPFWYFLGSTLAEIPFVIIRVFIFTAIYYPFVGFKGAEQGTLFGVYLALLVLMQTYLGQLFAYALPSMEVASLLGALYNSITSNFMGFNPPAAAIPKGLKWLYHITAQRYAFSNLVAVVFADCPDAGGSEIGCQILQHAPVQLGQITAKTYIESNFHMKYDDLGRNLLVVVGCIIIFRLLALLSLRFINHQKR